MAISSSSIWATRVRMCLHEREEEWRVRDGGGRYGKRREEEQARGKWDGME